LALLARLPEELRPPIQFAYVTGWRLKSEVLPLTWEQVDLEAGTVRLLAGTTKNGDGRIIWLTEEGAAGSPGKPESNLPRWLHLDLSPEWETYQMPERSLETSLPGSQSAW
jgi:integrase